MLTRLAGRVGLRGCVGRAFKRQPLFLVRLTANSGLPWTGGDRREGGGRGEEGEGEQMKTGTTEVREADDADMSVVPSSLPLTLQPSRPSHLPARLLCCSDVTRCT